MSVEIGRPAKASNPSRKDDQYAAAAAGVIPSLSSAAVSAAGRLFSAARTITSEGSNTASVAASKSLTSTASAQPATTAAGEVAGSSTDVPHPAAAIADMIKSDSIRFINIGG